MAAKEEAQIIKGLAVPFIVGTVVVISIALLGRIMTGKKT